MSRLRDLLERFGDWCSDLLDPDWWRWVKRGFSEPEDR